MAADREICRFWGRRGVVRWSCEDIEIVKRTAKYILETTMMLRNVKSRWIRAAQRSIYDQVVIRQEMLGDWEEERVSGELALGWWLVEIAGCLKQGVFSPVRSLSPRPQCEERSVQKMAEMFNGYCTV
jgi:hypothetical protein